MKIKKELESEYEKYITNNKDAYGKCAVDAGESVGKALDKGVTPEEAMGELSKHKDLTGFLAGAAIEGVCYFNPRGEELRIAWNKKYNVTEDKGGVVNPAIITIKI